MNTIRIKRRGVELVAWLSRGDAALAAKSVVLPEGGRLKIGVLPATGIRPECYVLVESDSRILFDAAGQVPDPETVQGGEARTELPIYQRLAAWREELGLSRREALRVLAASSPAELNELFSRYARVNLPASPHAGGC